MKRYRIKPDQTAYKHSKTLAKGRVTGLAQSENDLLKHSGHKQTGSLGSSVPHLKLRWRPWFAVIFTG